MNPIRTHVMGILAVGLCLSGLAPADASAQMLRSTDRAFGGISFGAQTKARTYTADGSLPVYEETATFDSVVGIGSSSILDISVGARVWNNVGVGLGWSRYSDTTKGTINASIPSPLVFDSPTSSSASLEGLEHRQSQIHFSAYWLQPMTDKIDLSFFAGPTFFSVKQDVATGFTVEPGTSTIGSITQTKISESTVGLHAGVDVRYLVTENLGGGLFVRFTSGSVDTSVLTESMKVGGFQYGVGLRFRY